MPKADSRSFQSHNPKDFQRPESRGFQKPQSQGFPISSLGFPPQEGVEGAAGPGGIRAGNGVRAWPAPAKWKLAKGLQGCARARGHLMERTLSEQSDSSSHSLCSPDTQSCLLFARLSGEQHGPARVLLAGMGSPRIQEPPKPGMINSSSPGRGQQLQSSSGSWHQGAPPRAQGMLQGEATPGSTSAPQAGKSSPVSATCKAPARTSVSSQRGKKKAQTLTVQDPRTLQNYRRGKLGCKQRGVCRAVTDFSRAQATPLVHSVSDQHQPLPREHFPPKAVRQRVGSPSSAGIPEQTSPQR